MTIGHRIERFRFKTARTVRKAAPWAKAVHRLGPCLHIAYECPEDGLEEFGSLPTHVVCPSVPMTAVLTRNRFIDGTKSRACTRCHTWKPEAMFNRTKHTSKSWCDECIRAYDRMRYANGLKVYKRRGDL